MDPDFQIWMIGCQCHSMIECRSVRQQGRRGGDAVQKTIDDAVVHAICETKIVCVDDYLSHISFSCLFRMKRFGFKSL
ncbi:hypothetical protein SDC9_122442 [bioreactor metagenome]|uniref:Uncharacterized protein n=1 Tax=bioreactor metagenome TaxID=1076179 RepID=A0A645CEQ1_9ZZZZ